MFNDNNDVKLFWLFAVQKFIVYLSNALNSVLAITWIVGAIGQEGVSVEHTICSIIGTIGTIMFASKVVIVACGKHAWCITWVFLLGWICDIAILMVFKENPWVIVTATAVTTIVPITFFSTREILVNRIYSGDELTSFRNKVAAWGMVATPIGTTLGMYISATIDNMVLLSAGTVLLTGWMYIYQTRLLLEMVPKEEEKE